MVGELNLGAGEDLAWPDGAYERTPPAKQLRPANFVVEFFLGKLGRSTANHRRAEILVEVNQIAVQEIPTAFLATALRLHYNATLRGFQIGSLDSNITGRLIALLKRSFRSSHEKHRARYKAFRCSRWIRADKSVKKRHFAVAQDFLSNIDCTTLTSIEEMRFRGCLVGDLIYDDFLARNGAATIPLESPELRRHLIECIAVCAFLFEYFDEHKVAAVVGNHVYRQGLFPRIANFFGIPSYEVSLNRLAHISESFAPHSESARLREIFASLPARHQERGISWAQAELQGDRLSRDITTYHLKEPSGRKYENPEQFFDGRFAVLIALHCMTDSPHVRGIGIFPDYLEWLKFTLQTCQELNFLALVKPHPACPEISQLSAQLEEYSGFNVLPPDIALSQLAEAGLNSVITYSGNIGFEAALLGLPVVCGHPQNRYSPYSFVMSPTSREAYRNAIATSVSSPEPLQMAELQEYLFMSRKFFPDDMFFQDLPRVLRDATNSRSPSEHISQAFRRENGREQISQILNTLRNFIASGDQRLTGTHFVASKNRS